MRPLFIIIGIRIRFGIRGAFARSVLLGTLAHALEDFYRRVVVV